jgi:hypothetical protein
VAAEGVDEPVVKVTLSRIYDTVLEIDRKVDPLPAIVADHETRLRAAETMAHDHSAAIKALQASPGLTWRSVVTDLRNWVTLIAVTGGLLALYIQ